MQGQGCERSDDSTGEVDDRRRKSFTLFEMQNETVENELLEQFYQKTLDDEKGEDFEDEEKLEHMKQVLDRLSLRPKALLVIKYHPLYE